MTVQFDTPKYPVALFIYKRPKHTEQLLRSLAANHQAHEISLWVFADGPKAGATADDLHAIEQTRALLAQAWPFAQIQTRFQAQNKGLAASVIAGLTELLAAHEAAIVLEDDLILGPDFYRYMQRELALHHDAAHVAGISGYAYPSTYAATAHYLLPIGCSWGWAVYRRAWQLLDTDTTRLLHAVTPHKDRFDFGRYPFYNILQGQHAGTLDSWAILFYASFFEHQLRFVFPPSSLVANQGYGIDATHCTTADHFFDQVHASNALPLPVAPASWVPEAVAGVEQAFLKQNTPRPMALHTRMKRKLRQILGVKN